MGTKICEKLSGDGYVWRVADDESVVVHESHTFPTRHETAQNLFTNHAMMSIFVGAVARGDERGGMEASGVSFPDDSGCGVEWKIIGGDGEVAGESHEFFDDKFRAMDNLIITYTMLSVFVASVAQERTVGQ